MLPSSSTSSWKKMFHQTSSPFAFWTFTKVLRSLGCSSPPIATRWANFLNCSEGMNFQSAWPFMSSPLLKNSMTFALACKMSNVSSVKISVISGLLSSVSNSVLELTLSFRSFSMKNL